MKLKPVVPAQKTTTPLHLRGVSFPCFAAHPGGKKKLQGRKAWLLVWLTMPAERPAVIAVG